MRLTPLGRVRQAAAAFPAAIDGAGCAEKLFSSHFLPCSCHSGVTAAAAVDRRGVTLYLARHTGKMLGKRHWTWQEGNVICSANAIDLWVVFGSRG